MSKILKLTNGTELVFADESTELNMVNVLNSFSDVDIYANNISTENLALATFDGVPVTDTLVFVSIDAKKDAFDNVILTVTNRYKTEMEILEETQAQQDEVINYLLMNTEA